MKLNVGSGPQAPPSPEWITLDATAWPVRVRGDARALPFRDQTFEAVHCSHLIEHVPAVDAPVILSELRRVMRRDGVLYIAGPDGTRTKAIGATYWMYITRRGGLVPGWQHEWTCTVARLRGLLTAAGLNPMWATGIPQGHPPNAHHWPPDLEARFVCRRDDFGWPSSVPTGYAVIT